jgi:indole-3-glycerol phosphate synthase
MNSDATMQDQADILKKIIAHKVDEVNARKTRQTKDHLKDKAMDCPPPRGFEEAIQKTLRTGRPAVIAELKKASPSRGIIRKDFNPGEIARSYERSGATCLSVLTDVDFFQGSDENLIEAKSACSLPILRKDFMIDAYQI